MITFQASNQVQQLIYKDWWHQKNALDVHDGTDPWNTLDALGWEEGMMGLAWRASGLQQDSKVNPQGSVGAWAWLWTSEGGHIFPTGPWHTPFCPSWHLQLGV